MSFLNCCGNHSYAGFHQCPGADRLSGMIVEKEINRSMGPGNKGWSSGCLGKQNSLLAHWLFGF